MSSTTSLNRQNAVLSSAEIVQQQISSVNTQIQGLGQDMASLANQVRDLVAQLQALKPPSAPGGDASDSAMQAYQQAMANYQRQVANIKAKIDQLNARSQQIATKIGELQNKVHRLESGDLPDAQRRDTERQEAELKAAREQYENVAKSLEKSQAQVDADQAAKRDSQRVQMRVGGATSDTSAAADQHLTLRVQWQNHEIQFDQNSDLKTLVKAFRVALGVAGDGSDFARRANPAVAMPHTPALGLPPVETP